MADTFKLEIVSPENLVLSADVSSVTVPGTEGYFTVVGEHAPIMTVLKAGFINLTDGAGKESSYYVRGGFADVSGQALTILAEEAKGADDFNSDEITANLAEAEAALSAAEGDEAIAVAHAHVDGWKNLMIEVEATRH